MALIGNGAQSEFQAIAFHHMLGIRELRLYDTDPRATAKLERNLRGCCSSLDLRVVRCASRPPRPCAVSDIVTTVTADKCNAMILTPAMIEPGMHLNAIGGDCPGKTELHARHPAQAGCACRRRVRATVAHRGRDPAARRDIPGHRVQRCGVGQDARAATNARRGDDFRFGRLCAGGLLGVAIPASHCTWNSAAHSAGSTSCPHLDDPKDLFGGARRHVRASAAPAAARSMREG